MEAAFNSIADMHAQGQQQPAAVLACAASYLPQHAQCSRGIPGACLLPKAWYSLPSSPLLAYLEELLWWQLPEHVMRCQLLAQRHHGNSWGSEVQLLLAPLHQVAHGVHLYICQQACRAGNSTHGASCQEACLGRRAVTMSAAGAQGRQDAKLRL